MDRKFLEILTYTTDHKYTTHIFTLNCNTIYCIIQFIGAVHMSRTSLANRADSILLHRKNSEELKLKGIAALSNVKACL